MPNLIPVPADLAQELITEMRLKTNRNAAIAVLRLALGKHGNLSPEAAEIYRKELTRLLQTK